MDSKIRDLLSAAAEYVEKFGEITEAPKDSDCWDVVDKLRAAHMAKPAESEGDATRDMVEALKRCMAQLAEFRRKKLNFGLELAIATAGKAIHKAEGAAT